LKELGDMWTNIKVIAPSTPGLQRGSRHVEFFGGLTFRDALSAQLLVLLKEVRTFESIPTGLAFRVAWLWVLD
jgi:hypothetical protein